MGNGNRLTALALTEKGVVAAQQFAHKEESVECRNGIGNQRSNKFAARIGLLGSDKLVPMTANLAARLSKFFSELFASCANVLQGLWNTHLLLFGLHKNKSSHMVTIVDRRSSGCWQEASPVGALSMPFGR